MPSTTLSRGNQLYDTGIVATITPPASIVATAATPGTYTIAGLLPLDMISVYPTSSITTYSMASAYVSAPNTLIIMFTSETGGTVSSAAAVTIQIEVVRLENSAGLAGIPTSFN